MIPAPPRSRLAFEAIGTDWSITTPEPLPEGVRMRVHARIAEYDRAWSRFRDDSLVAELARTCGPVRFGEEARDLLGLLTALAGATGGAMTPLIGDALEHLGYDAAYSLVPGAGYRAAPPLSVLHVDGTTVTLDEPAVLDVGSAGKGQLVDLVAAELVGAGVAESVVDGGRDLRVAGEPLTAALEHPYDDRLAIGVVEVRDAALCASAVTRRAWDGRGGALHHVLDGRTGRPVEQVAATWVLAPSALAADALSTALFFAEPAGLEASGRFGPFEWVRMRTDGRLTASASWPGELFR